VEETGTAELGVEVEVGGGNVRRDFDAELFEEPRFTGSADAVEDENGRLGGGSEMKADAGAVVVAVGEARDFLRGLVLAASRFRHGIVG
jgi:hypothetical protein